jgi:hypothetical protein
MQLNPPDLAGRKQSSPTMSVSSAWKRRAGVGLVSTHAAGPDVEPLVAHVADQMPSAVLRNGGSEVSCDTPINRSRFGFFISLERKALHLHEPASVLELDGDTRQVFLQRRQWKIGATDRTRIESFPLDFLQRGVYLAQPCLRKAIDP